MIDGIYGAGKGKGINRAGEGIVRADYGRPSSSALHNNNKMDSYFSNKHPLTNFEIQKYYKNEPRFNRVFSL